MSFFDKIKHAGKSIVDSGAKTMLKTDIVFLEREVKSRKQRFGVEVYELMEALEVDSELTIDEKEGRIRMAFDRARKDIAVIQAKIDCKNEEMSTLETDFFSAGATAGAQAAASPAETAEKEAETTSSGTNHIITTGHPDDDKPSETKEVGGDAGAAEQSLTK